MSNSYYFQYDTSTGVIYPYLQSNAPASSSTMGVLGPYPQETASSQVVMAYNFPERFLAKGSPVVLVEQPYFTLDATESTSAPNQYTLTAKLNHPPSTPPTDVTFTVLGQTFSEELSSNQATFTLALHPSIAKASVSITAGATGCATSRPSAIGGTSSVSVALQVYTPSGGVPTVAPTGTGSRSFLAAYYALSPASIESLLPDIGTAVSLAADVQYRKGFAAFRILNNLYQWATGLQTNPYVPTTQDNTDIKNVQFDKDELNAESDISANILPNLFTTLTNAYPSGGSEQLQFLNMRRDLAKTFTAFTSYMSDLNSIPNLA